MPNSVLWICLVAVWLLVLVPMVINKGRPQVRKSTAVAASTRTLHRGGKATAGRKKAGAHPSDPAHKPSRTPSATAIALLEKKEAELRAEEAAQKNVTDDEAESGSDSVATDEPDAAVIETAEADTEDADADNEVTAELSVTSTAGVDLDPDATDSDTTDSDTTDSVTTDADTTDADTTDADIVEFPTDTETDAAAGEYYGPDEAALESDDLVESDDLDESDDLNDTVDRDRNGELDETADPEDESDDLGDTEPADDLEDDLIDDDLLTEAKPGPARVEQAPVTTTAPRKISPSRSKESLADKHSDARYKERQRVLIGFVALFLGSIVAGIVLGLVGWVVMALAAVSLVAYLAFLRRAVVREQQARAQRAARAARLRREEARRREQEEQQARIRPVVPEPPRRRRPGGAVVLEIDDEDPVFEHLPNGPRRLYFDGTSDEEYRRAVG